jgi:hypothetical protein
VQSRTACNTEKCEAPAATAGLTPDKSNLYETAVDIICLGKVPGFSGSTQRYFIWNEALR